MVAETLYPVCKRARGDNSQKAIVKKHLYLYGSITPLEALRLYGCFRLGARIWELKKDGEPIPDPRMIEINGKRIAQYYLANYNATGQLSLF